MTHATHPYMRMSHYQAGAYIVDKSSQQKNCQKMQFFQWPLGAVLSQSPIDCYIKMYSFRAETDIVKTQNKKQQLYKGFEFLSTSLV